MRPENLTPLYYDHTDDADLAEEGVLTNERKRTMSRKITSAAFEALSAEPQLHAVEARGDDSVVTRLVDARGCTAAVAIHTTAAPPTYIEYTLPGSDADEYIVAHGVAWPAAQYEGNLEEVNGPDAVRIYAVDEESALAIAAAYDRGEVAPDETVLGAPGIVQRHYLS